MKALVSLVGRSQRGGGLPIPRRNPVLKKLSSSEDEAERAIAKAHRDAQVRTSSRRGLNAGGGGEKGQAILKALEAHPEWSRRQIAEEVGCTVTRVGEVCRWLAKAPKVEAPKAKAPARKTPAKKAPATRARKAATTKKVQPS